MDLSTLLQFISGKATAREREAVGKWLEDDPDGTHFELFNDAHDIFNGMTLHTPETSPTVIVPVRSKKRVVFKTILRMIAAAAAVFVGLHFGEKEALERVASSTETLSVPVGKYLDVTLEDGTKVWLNSGTEITYPKIFSEDKRGIRLEKGEILLDVAKDEKRPFVVETFAADVKVYGTRLDIISEPEEGTFKTALFRGSVGVSPKLMVGTEFMLYPSQSISLGPEDSFIKETFDESDGLDSWTNGLLNIANLGFVELMEKIEKAFGTTVIIEAETVPVLDIKRGKVRVNDGVDHALDVIRMNKDFNFVHDYNSNTIIIN